MRSNDLLLRHLHQFFGPKGLEEPLGHRQKDVVPGLGRVQEAGLLSLDGRHIFGRGAPEVEKQLVHRGLAAPKIPVGLGKAGSTREVELQGIIINGLAHLGFDLGQQPRPGPHHLLAGDEGLEPADLQIGVGLPGQAQGFP